MLAPYTITLYALIPMVVALFGGLVAALYIPKPRLVSTLQHFVAGIVIGAVAIELLPKILGHSSIWTIGLGFVLGALVMLLLHEFAHFIGKKEGRGAIPIGLISAAAVDLLIDGMLIGVAFLAGEKSGIVIAVSLSMCAFFLTLAVTTTMRRKKSKIPAQVAAVILIAVMLPLGAWIGSGIISQLPPIMLVETIAFGVAALLFLGVEELLAEAHAEHDTIWTSGAFFLGFLVILLFTV